VTRQKWGHVRTKLTTCQTSKVGLLVLYQRTWEVLGEKCPKAKIPGKSRAQANYNSKSSTKTIPVDSFKTNPWGLHNVHGNVWEWTEDCWNNTNAGNPGDGNARTSGDCNRRVVRGGSWRNHLLNLRSANRFGVTSDFRYHDQGFRLARTLDP